MGSNLAIRNSLTATKKRGNVMKCANGRTLKRTGINDGPNAYVFSIESGFYWTYYMVRSDSWESAYEAFLEWSASKGMLTVVDAEDRPSNEALENGADISGADWISWQDDKPDDIGSYNYHADFYWTENVGGVELTRFAELYPVG